MLFVKSSVYGVNTAIFRGSIARTFVSTASRTVTAGAPAPFWILSPISRSWANVPSAPAEVQPNITTSGAVVRMSSMAFGRSLSNIRNSSSRVTSSRKMRVVLMIAVRPIC
jgi:hypothetical protein